jgi:hypothetical protein
MPAWLPTALKAILALAALVAIPVQTWLTNQPAVEGVLGFVAALVALFIKSPLSKPEPAKVGDGLIKPKF